MSSLDVERAPDEAAAAAPQLEPEGEVESLELADAGRAGGVYAVDAAADGGVSPLTPAAVLALQSTAGNAAVASLLEPVQQANGAAPAREPDARPKPEEAKQEEGKQAEPKREDAKRPPQGETTDAPPPPAAPAKQAAAPPAPAHAAAPHAPKAFAQAAHPNPNAAAAPAGSAKAASAPHAKPHGGGGGGPKGGGGAVSDLDAWKSATASAAAEIKPPALDDVAGSAGKLADHAKGVEEQRRAERPDFEGEARSRLPKEPEEPPREQALDTAPADAAVAAVEQVGTARLPDQTFPALKPLPAYQGGPPGGGGGGAAPALPPAPTAAAPAAGKAAGGPTTADPQADEVKSKVAAAGPTTAGAGAAGPVTLADKGAASLKPLPPAQAAEIGDAVARVLQDVGTYAKQIVDAGAAKLDPTGKVAALNELALPLVATQQEELQTELQGVAASAGVSAEALKAKVEAQHAEAEKKAAAASSELDAKAAAAKDGVKKRGDEEQKTISGASAAVQDEVERKQQAAQGGADPALIESKRDRYLEQVESTSAAAAARLRASSETRAADLERVCNEQKAAYRQQSRAEAERIKGLYPDDATKGKIESRPVLDWAEQQCLEVDGAVARLKREAAAEAKRLQEPLDAAAQKARDQIRDWAAEKAGRQRSWWERLFDMFKDWASKSKADSKAWEAQRNAETRDKAAGDFDLLVRMRDELAAGNQEAVKAELSRLSKEQQAVVAAFFKSGGKDAIGAVAVGLIERIKTRRVPELGKKLEEQAIASLPWEALNQLGAAQTPGFDAGIIVRDVRGSVKGWGTDEKRLWKALQGRTPLQIAAMRKAYKATYPGRDMDEDINDDVDGSERERADAYLSGDSTAGAVAALNDAMDGAGTDEATIMQTLRGKTPAERDAIAAAYKEKYGTDLKAALADEMEDNDLDQANALLDGDTTKADAIELNEAMDGVGTDEAGINAVYSRIREEVEADARRKGMSTAEVEAEIKRRTSALRTAYGAKYAGGDEGALERDFRDELSGGELNLALAEQAVDQTAMDAAKLQIEHESFYTDDDKVNALLRAQHDRAEKEVMRDMSVEFNEKAAGLNPEQRKQLREQMEAKAKADIEARSKDNMKALEARYDSDNPEFGPGAFRRVIEYETSGYSHDEALERIEAGGKLSDAKELKYAMFGLGTNEDAIKQTLKGKSKEEIEKLKKEYKDLTGNDLVADLQGDLAGRDWADTKFMLDGTKTLEEQMAYLKKRKEWEVNDGTGVLGELFEDEEEDVLERTAAEAEDAYAEYDRLKKAYGEDDPRTQAAKERLERWLGYGDKDIEEHRAALDSITDTIATGLAIVAGVAVTILTAGAAGPLVLGAAAALGTSTVVVAGVAGAVVATATSMLTKELMKGGAYDCEQIAVDLAQGTLEAVVVAATAGTGEAALQALFKNPAFAALKEAAESGALAKIVTKGVESGLEGAIQGLPSGMAGAILNENTWKGDNPLGTILAAGGKGSGMGAGMGAVMGGTMEGIKGAGGGPHGPAPEPTVAVDAAAVPVDAVPVSVDAAPVPVDAAPAPAPDAVPKGPDATPAPAPDAPVGHADAAPAAPDLQPVDLGGRPANDNAEVPLDNALDLHGKAANDNAELKLGGEPANDNAQVDLSGEPANDNMEAQREAMAATGTDDYLPPADMTKKPELIAIDGGAQPDAPRAMAGDPVGNGQARPETVLEPGRGSTEARGGGTASDSVGDLGAAGGGTSDVPPESVQSPESEVRERVEELRNRYGETAQNRQQMEEALRQIERIAAKDPASALEALNNFEELAAKLRGAGAADPAADVSRTAPDTAETVPGENEPTVPNVDEPSRMPELESGVDPTWEPEGRWRLPAENRGQWIDGTPGNGRWEPHDPGAYGLEKGQSIPFKEGVPDFGEFTQQTPGGRPGTVEVEGLTGNTQPELGPTDYERTVAAIAARERMTVPEVEAWLQANNLRLHHFSGNEMQIVPERLHGALGHQGSATELRN